MSPDAEPRGRSYDTRSVMLRGTLLVLAGTVLVSLVGLLAWQSHRGWAELAELGPVIDWPGVLLGIAVTTLAMPAAAARWKVLLPRRGKPGVPMLTAIQCVGVLFNYALPGPAGELVAAVMVQRRYGYRLAEVLVASAVARLMGLGVGAAMAAIFFLAFPLPLPEGWIRPVAVGVSCMLLGALAISWAAARPEHFRGLVHALLRRPSQGDGRLADLIRKGQGAVDSVLDALAATRRRGIGPLLQAIAWTALGHTISPTGVAIAAWSMGIDVSWAGVVFTNTFTMVGVVALFLFPASYLGWDALYCAVLSASSAVPLAQAAAVTAVARLQQSAVVLAGVLSLVLVARGLLPRTLVLPGKPSAGQPSAAPRRRGYPWPLKLLLGLLVSAGLLGLGELAARQLWPYQPQRVLIHPMWAAGDPLVATSTGAMRRAFQGDIALPPIPERDPAGPPRVLVFGESSVHGTTAASLELPAQLQAALGELGQDAEVLNMGCPAIDSERMLQVVRASRQLQPDLALIYAGHNDAGNSFMARAFGDPGAIEAWERSRSVERLALVRLAAWALASAGLPPGSLAGAGVPSTDPQTLDDAAARWESNLGSMVRSLQGAGVAVMLATPIADLCAWPSPIPTCLQALPEAWRITPTGHWELAERAPASSVERALLQAPACPEALQLRGRNSLDQGLIEPAITDLRRAKDLDPIPLRATEDILAATRRVAQRQGVELLDTAALLDAEPPPWSPWFVDQLHPSDQGAGWLATKLAPAVIRLLEQRAQGDQRSTGLTGSSGVGGAGGASPGTPPTAPSL